MHHRLIVLAALAAVSLTGGCGLLTPADSDSPTPTTATTATAKATAQATGGADSGFGSVKDSGDIPDPCTLLEKQEVTHLTGREITQIDEDGAEPGEGTRFCQWQQSGGQLAIFLTRTTPADFQSAVDGAEPVDGVGEDAFALSGHLFVLYGTVQLDVYSRGESDAQNLTDAKKVAKVLLPRV